MFSGPGSENETLEVGLPICVLTSFLGDSDANLHLRWTALAVSSYKVPFKTPSSRKPFQISTVKSDLFPPLKHITDNTLLGLQLAEGTLWDLSASKIT